MMYSILNASEYTMKTIHIPILTAPEGVDIWSEDPDVVELRDKMEHLVESIVDGEATGVLIPSGWQLSSICVSIEEEEGA
jgi:hypothetical protein